MRILLDARLLWGGGIGRYVREVGKRWLSDPTVKRDLVAVTARAHGLVLVTHNTREFEEAPGLRIDDWESAGGVG